MSDYITKEQAIEVIGYAYLNNLTRDERVNEIKALPSADVVERKRGHWEDCSNGWMCSECFRDVTYSTDFCPHCGADMRERKDNDS